jgi:hypothetical protein
MLKRTIVALAVAALAVPAVAQAQENATVTLRNGDRVTGQVVDLGGVGLTVRANGQDRQIPTGQVSVIDFTGSGMTQSDWDKFTAGANVWLRNGQTISGQLYDISGTTPLKIIIKTDSGDRDFSSNEVSRIVLARPEGFGGTGSTSTPAAQIPGGAGVSVSANQQWTPTGLTVRRGETLTFNASGEARLGGGGETARPSGTGDGRRIENGPLPQVPAGALIARVGNGAPFPIGGPTATVSMPAAGQLFLGINDDHVADNEGGYRVDIQRATNRSRR